MRGGYQPADNAYFTVCTGGCKDSKAVRRVMHTAYTVERWERVYGFVYFSHARISVPPAEWTHAAHKHGALALATILCEDESGAVELCAMLASSTRTAAVLQALVRLCDFYGFDGYLLNLETPVVPWQVPVLLGFCSQLRAQLNESMTAAAAAAAAAAHNSQPRCVLWYDAVTREGVVRYQNALTAQNEPFFNACDGLFTNYFWAPAQLAVSAHNATKARHTGPLRTRLQDVFVGVDVFGRNMYGGGQYATHRAVRAAVQHGLSVALFAPGWTAEMKAHDTRAGFLRAERRLWAAMEDCLPRYAREATRSEAAGVLWTSFSSGVGAMFAVNGRPVAKDETGCWCQLSAAQELPPAWDVAPSTPEAEDEKEDGREEEEGEEKDEDDEEMTMRLYAMPAGGQSGAPCIAARWSTRRAWFGDRALRLTLPPMATVQLTSWYIRDVPLRRQTNTATRCDAAEASCATENTSALFAVDVVWCCDGASRAAMCGCALRVQYIAAKDDAGDARDRQDDVESTAQGEAWPLGNAARACVLDLQGFVLSGSDAHVSLLTANAASETRAEGCDATQSTADEWCIVRYLLQSTKEDNMHAAQDGCIEPAHVDILGLGLVNTDATTSLRCGIGGIAVHSLPASTTQTTTREGVATSPLQASTAYEWPHYTVYPTDVPAEYVLALREVSVMCQAMSLPRNTFTPPNADAAEEDTNVEVVLVADVCSLETGTRHTLYLGRHTLRQTRQGGDVLYVVWSATTPCRVEEVRCHRICSGG